MKPFDIAGPLPTGLTVIEASAGTGKTWAIAALAVRYLAEGLVTAPHLLAVTFTHLASADLRSRLYQRLLDVTTEAETGQPTDELAKLICDGPPDVVAARITRLHQAIGDFDAATVATIHEFCGRAADWLGPLTGIARARTDNDACADLAEQTVADVTLGRLLGGADSPNAETCYSLGSAALANRELRVIPEDDEAARFAQTCREEYARRKATLGVGDYADLALRLDAALADPVTGPGVADIMAACYHVVLVDEFQDTDPVQWSILRQAFGKRCPLVLVGDPKQSIYGFRGADVYAYLEAVKHADDTFTLPVNYRSDSAVVEAVSELFAGVDFGQQSAPIPMRASQAAHLEPRLKLDGVAASGLQIRRLPGTGVGQRKAIVDDVVGVVASTLAARPRLQVAPDRWRPLRADDIAVLVTSNRKGLEISNRLHQAGLPAVFSGVTSVFASEAAGEWLLLLDALAHPRPATLRRAMISRLIGLTLSQLAAAGGEAVMDWSARLREWSGSRLDPSALLDRLDTLTDLPARLLATPDGERMLTDVNHLGELLSAQVRQTDDPASLLVWLRTRRDAALQSGGGDRTRRLETDRPAVNVLTVHAAKGLEFPVVLVPGAADASPHTWGSPTYPMVWRDAGVRVLDTRIGGPGQTERRQAWADEQATEDRRRLYVALTRASTLTIAWEGDRAAILTGLLRANHEGVSLMAVDPPSGLPAITRPASPPLLDVNTFERQIDDNWTRTSYSGLTAGLHDTVIETDEPDDADDSCTSPIAEGLLSPLDALPAGAAFGTVVHAVFEAIDPASPTLRADLAEAAIRARRRSTLPDLDAQALATGLEQVLYTPLGPLAGGASLASLGAGRRLTELGFEMPMGVASPSARCDKLADVFDEFVPGDDPLAGYGAQLAGTAAAERALRGFLTGSIDLVVELGDKRVLLADYKTNRLGRVDAPNHVAGYNRAAMGAAMKANHYPLQALLYAVALRRYLACRRPKTSFDDQWAGVTYLFVRGMAGPDTPDSDGSPCGVFSWRPPAAMIEQADAVLRGGAS